MMHTKRLVIVEGKYDKIKLEGILDALILTTDGYRIFKDKQKIAFIREQAEKNGILILTDSDAAGFRIRNYICSFVPTEYILNAYIPDVPGKEKRKTSYSSEGKIGVEGIDEAVLADALKKAGIEQEAPPPAHTSVYDLYTLGVYGTVDSKAKRARLIAALGLPERISKNNLLKYINRNLSKAEFLKIMEEINV